MSARAVRIAPFVALAALTLFAAVVVPVSIDAGAFMYMGRILIRGGTPYLDAWDHKGPVQYVLNAGALLIGGDSPRGVLMVEALCTALALAWTLRRWAARIGEREAALIGVALVLAYAMFWSCGDLAETVLFPSQLMAYTALLECVAESEPSDRAARWAGALVGGAAAIGIGTRMNNAMGIVAAAGAFVLWRRTRAVGFVLSALLAATLVLGPVVVLFHARGALPEMWDQYWVFNTRFNTTTVLPHSRVENGRLLVLLYARSPLALITAAAALLLVRNRVRAPRSLLLIGTALVGLEFVAQLISGQGFRHYLVTTLPSLATFAVVLRIPMAHARPDARTVWPRTVASRVIAALVVALWALSTWRAIDAMRVAAVDASSVGDAPLAQVAAEVRAHVPDGAPIYGTGNFGAVLAVADRPASTRYFNDYPLHIDGYGPKHVRMLAAALIARPPVAIVRVPGTCSIMDPGPECLPASLTLTAFARGRYTLSKRIDDYEVWVRNTP